MKILITGVGGTGKSTITKALNEKGVATLDLHDIPELFFLQNKETKERVIYTPSTASKDWYDATERFCDLDKLKEVFFEIKLIKMRKNCCPGESQHLELYINTGFLFPLE